MKRALSKDCTDITRGDKLEEGLRLLSFFLSAEFEISKIYIYKLKSLCEFYCLDMTAWIAETQELMRLPRWGKGEAWNWKKIQSIHNTKTRTWKI